MKKLTSLARRTRLASISGIHGNTNPRVTCSVIMNSAPQAASCGVRRGRTGCECSSITDDSIYYSCILSEYNRYDKSEAKYDMAHLSD